jgi:putative ABC transport system permease protein
VELSNDEVEEDMLRGLEGAVSAIDLMRLLMWIVAAVIIGAVIYLSTLERLNDFAVLKAVGGESRSLAMGLALQALIAAVVAGVLGIAFATLLGPAFPLRVTVGPGSYALLIVVAAVVGIVSSMIALRRVLKVDPALAFS